MKVILLGLVLLTALASATEDVNPYALIWEGETDIGMIPGGNLHWLFNDDRSEITFTITASVTKKWIGFGISSSGSMKWAEIFICNPVKGTLDHMWSKDYTTPEILEKNYSGLEEISETETTTMCRFTIPTKSCMGEQFDIQEYTSRIIYAMGDVESFQYHGSDRGYQQILFNVDASLLELPFPTEEEIGDTVHKWDVDFKDVPVKAELNSYFCMLDHHPDAVDYKNGIKDYDDYPDASYIINANYHSMGPYVHHIFIWSCPRDFTYNFDTESSHAAHEVFECEDIMYECNTILGGWAPGTVYGARKSIGLQVNGLSDWSTMVIQVHYNNPNLDENISDDSSMTFYYTYEEPEMQTWLYATGVAQNLLLIPPQVPKYRAISNSAPQCTADWEGQYMTSFQFHMHNLGSRGRFSIIRDGAEHTVFYESSYDYDFQTTYNIDPPFEILPHDQFYVECTYDTSDVDDYTYGGDYTEEEMCYIFVKLSPDPTEGTNHVCFAFNDPLAPQRLRCEEVTGDKECVDYDAEVWYNRAVEGETFENTDLSYREFEFKTPREPSCNFDLPIEIIELYEDQVAYQQKTPEERANNNWPGIDEDSIDEDSDIEDGILFTSFAGIMVGLMALY